MCRNPYERLVSGFCEKYLNGQFTYRWRGPLTFRKFVKSLVNKDWVQIDKVHFQPQFPTLDQWYKIEKNTRKIILWDLSSIDYEYLASFFPALAPDPKMLKNWYRGRHTSKRDQLPTWEGGKVCDLEGNSYINNHVLYQDFYDPEIIALVDKFFKRDFEIPKRYNISYQIKES